MKKEGEHLLPIYKRQKKSGRHCGDLLLAALLAAAFISGCGQAAEKTGKETAAELGGLSEEAGDQSQPEAAQDSSASEIQNSAALGAQERSDVETALVEKLQEAAGKEIVLFDCADFDGDGCQEAFAVVGERNQDVITGAIWFVGENSGAICLSASDGSSQEGALCLQAFSGIYEMPDGKKIWQTETFGGSVTTSLIWGVEHGAAKECVLSGKGAQFEEIAAGEYQLWKPGLDAGTDGTGRTMKPCYFFYENGAFYEYGAVSLVQGDLMEIPGLEEVVRSYEEKGCWNHSILLRGNGLVQLNFQDRSHNSHVTLAVKDGRLETVEEGEGLAGLLIGGIADQTWRGAEDALRAVWDEAMLQNPGVTMKIYPGEMVYYDLDGDGTLEKIRYQESVNEETEDFVDGLTVFVDGEEVWENTEAMAEWCKMYVTDLDSLDGKRELIAEYCSANDVVMGAKFLRYEDGKMTEIGDLCESESVRENGFIRYQGSAPDGFGPVIPGDKTVTAWVDTPFWKNGFGSYYVKMNWQYDNGVLKEAWPQENEENFRQYQLRSLADGRPWPYQLIVPVTVYGEAECITPVYEACPGEVLYAAALRAADGEGAPLCIGVEVAGTDVTGWIQVGDDQIFEEIPAWG